MTAPLATSRSLTVLLAGRTSMHSQPVRTSTANMVRKVLASATSSADSCSITSPTWYGSPQLA